MDNATEPVLRVYVNSAPVEVPVGATAADAVAAWDAAVGVQVRAGERAITDSRGILTPNGGAVYAGAIYRIVRGGMREESA